MRAHTDFEKQIHKIHKKEQALFQNPPSEGADDRISLYYKALIDPNGEKNLAVLKKEGINLSEENSIGEDLIALLERHLEETRYPHSKKGELDRRKDTQILQKLKKMKEDGTLAGSGRKRRKVLIGVLLAVVLLLAVTAFSFSYQLFDSSEEVTEDADTENTADETGIIDTTEN